MYLIEKLLTLIVQFQLTARTTSITIDLYDRFTSFLTQYIFLLPYSVFLNNSENDAPACMHACMHMPHVHKPLHSRREQVVCF